MNSNWLFGTSLKKVSRGGTVPWHPIQTSEMHDFTVWNNKDFTPMNFLQGSLMKYFNRCFQQFHCIKIPAIAWDTATARTTNCKLDSQYKVHIIILFLGNLLIFQHTACVRNLMRRTRKDIKIKIGIIIWFYCQMWLTRPLLDALNDALYA